MRLVCLADTHMFHEDLKRIPDGDLLVHAGDLTRVGDEASVLEVARFLAAQPHRHKIVVAGNHDFLFQEQPERARSIMRDAGCVYLEDTEVTIEGVRIYGSPWTPIFFDWAFMLKRGPDIAAKWSLIPVGLDVLITHGPPRGILDDASAYRAGKIIEDGEPMNVGCDHLRARVREVKPRVHLFGHIHGQQGVHEADGTRFVNCTTSECEQPPIVIDL